MNNNFCIFAQNNDCRNVRNALVMFESVLTGTHGLCFDSEIRKKSIPLHTPVFIT